MQKRVFDTVTPRKVVEFFKLGDGTPQDGILTGPARALSEIDRMVFARCGLRLEAIHSVERSAGLPERFAPCRAH